MRSYKRKRSIAQAGTVCMLGLGLASAYQPQGRLPLWMGSTSTRRKEPVLDLHSLLRAPGKLGRLMTAAAGLLVPSDARGAVRLDYYHQADTRTVASAPQTPRIDYGCLFSQCGRELGGALLDPRGLHELVCLTHCGPSDIACQMKCGDMYKDDVLNTFHTCAISRHACVPQRVEPPSTVALPDPSSLVPSLRLQDLRGRWYVTHGISSIFDCFPCQQNTVAAPEPELVTFDVSYEVPHGAPLRSFERKLRQRFKQDMALPGLLHSSETDYLRQEDDWYIVAADPSRYIFVYYVGCNAAWCGYSGGVVYSRQPQLDPQAVPEIRSAAQRLGLSFERFCPVDNGACSLRAEGGQGGKPATLVSREP